jgi:hypothetical protein
VFLPQPRWPDGRLRPEYAWVEDFIDSCAALPRLRDHERRSGATSMLVRSAVVHQTLVSVPAHVQRQLCVQIDTKVSSIPSSDRSDPGVSGLMRSRRTA